LIAGVVIGCAFAVIALIAVLACVMSRRRNMEQARVELAARSGSWFDPKFLTVAAEIGQTIGWRRLASLAALGILAAGVTKEWSARNAAAADDDEESAED
jgi:prepilin signal peptidase PulO-like enzyme (type II secretory pathway)